MEECFAGKRRQIYHDQHIHAAFERMHSLHGFENTLTILSERERMEMLAIVLWN